MLDIKSGVLMLGVITTLLLVGTSFTDLKSEMKHMKTQMEQMKELHSNTEETLELTNSNRRFVSKRTEANREAIRALTVRADSHYKKISTLMTYHLDIADSIEEVKSYAAKAKMT